LLDIVKVILDQCPRLLLLNFPTNGFLTKTIVSTIEKILTLKPPELFITVSLDGAEKLNDEIRGVRGGWKRQIKTFQEVHGLPGIKSALGLTLSPFNLDQFETAFEAAQRECPWLTYDDFHINVYHTSFYYGNTEQPLTPREEENILQQINRYRRLRRVKFHPISFLEGSYLKRVETYLRSGLTPVPCHALRSSCFMDPSGNIFPCSMYERSIGNIRDHDYRLLSIWKSESAVQVQREIEDFHCPQCWTPCEAYQSILGNLAPRILKVRKRAAYP
jgi:radical SAM protein with 4Fe4S-binding SPASM domain